MSAITDIIDQVARGLGVDPKLAEATAQVESGLDPRRVGDQGSSFGLFMLHRGGELGNLSPEQAFDPFTNASVALSRFPACQQKYSDPGQVAACAQRPADPAGYAQKVDAALAGIKTGVGIGLGASGFPNPVTSSLNPTDAVGAGLAAAGQAIGAGFSGAVTTAGHGIADFFAVSLHDAELFLHRQAVALFVAVLVLLVLFH